MSKTVNVASATVERAKSSIKAGTWNLNTTDYEPMSICGCKVQCCGAELAANGENGILAVHLVEDYDDQSYLMPMTAGARSCAWFNKIYKSGTTVDVSKVTLFIGANE